MTDIRRVPIRPKLFDRVLFDIRPGMGGWVRDLFLEEQDDLLDRYSKARPGKLKDDMEDQIKWVASLLRDIAEAFGIPPEIQARRFRLWRGGQANWVAEVLRDEQEALYDDLNELRRMGKTEDDPEVAEAVERLHWVVNLLRDVDAVRIALVGANEDPRK